MLDGGAAQRRPEARAALGQLSGEGGHAVWDVDVAGVAGDEFDDVADGFDDVADEFDDVVYVGR